MRTSTRSRRWWAIALTLACVGVLGLRYVAGTRQVPVRLAAQPAKESFRPGEPVMVLLRIENGLGGPIRFSSYALEPNDWNGETTTCGPVDIYRNSEPLNLFTEAPKVSPPRLVAGMTSHPIAPGDKLEVRIDLSKWVIRDGWKPGSYSVTLKVAHVDLDDYISGSVISDPIRFEIRG